MGAGRPRISKEVADKVCELLASGMTLRKIAKMDGMPRPSTVMRHALRDEAFKEQYAQAMALRADLWFDEILDIADDGENDTYRDDEGKTKVDYDVLGRSRLRVDARKWVAARAAPKKYGDRAQVAHTDADGNSINNAPVINVYETGTQSQAGNGHANGHASGLFEPKPASKAAKGASKRSN